MLGVSPERLCSFRAPVHHGGGGAQAFWIFLQVFPECQALSWILRTQRRSTGIQPLGLPLCRERQNPGPQHPCTVFRCTRQAWAEAWTCSCMGPRGHGLRDAPKGGGAHEVEADSGQGRPTEAGVPTHLSLPKHLLGGGGWSWLPRKGSGVGGGECM